MQRKPATPLLIGQIGTLYHLGAAGTLSDGQLLERFLSRDDPVASEAAFTALVDRHGAMVLAVCRRILGDANDAHDAFQATFLVLVNKAGTIRNRESVGGWLLGIARRVAARARVDGARRRRHLQQLGAQRLVFEDGGDRPIPADPEPDFAPLVDEVDRLPERFRAPVVLHYFEGLSTEATAQLLGCPRGTVLSRLARARNRIKQRLEAQGVSFAALIPAGEALTCWIPPAPVPAWLAQTTVKAAGALALAGAAIESVVPATVAALSRGVARTLVLAKVRVVATLTVLAVVSVSIGLAATYTTPTDEPRSAAAADSPRAAVARSKAQSPEEEPPADPVNFRGQVLDSDGKPVAGAEILLVPAVMDMVDPRPPRRLTTTGDDGRFTVAISRQILEETGVGRSTVFLRPVLAARAPRFGPEWTAIDVRKSSNPITLRLRSDDVPVEGCVVNLEGRPVSGAKVSLSYVADFPPELLARLRQNAGKVNPELWGEMRNALLLGKDGSLPPVQTGPDGRFRMAGIGRDRAALLIVEGDWIEQSFAMMFTASDRSYTPIPLPSPNGNSKLWGPRFEVMVAPGRAIEGVVRDADTRRPIAGATIRSWMTTTTKSDAQGQFRIPGQPKRAGNQIAVVVEGEPYIKVEKAIGDATGLAPIPVEVVLKRGVWVEGRVIDRSSGRPVKAIVQYYPLRDNPHLHECPDASFLDNNVSDEVDFPTDADGRFRAVALPGGGILSIRTSEPGFLTAAPLAPRVAGNVLHAANFKYHMRQFQALTPIHPPAGERSAIPDILVAKGRTQHLRMIAPDGQPVAGVRLLGHPSLDAPSVGSEHNFVHADPGKAETVVMLQPDRSLAASLELKGDEPDPIRVSLQPAGTVVGRLVDEEGRPRPNIELDLSYQIKEHGRSIGTDSQPLETGPDGRFQIKNLVPGLSYSVRVMKKNEPNFTFRAEGYLHKAWWTVKSGETQDWGDVPVQSYRR
jgi:RNA polymerase sigma factor (sigma-70 family)